MKPTVLVALSGGVDSSVAAALLKKEGYPLVGVYMKNWSDTAKVRGVCAWKTERRDALRVAAHLGIPLITLDFEKEYRKLVVSYLFREYKAGRTPNPDVLCNRYIKFGSLLREAKRRGITVIATGHYAGVVKRGGSYRLLTAKDTVKDQTYFLHELSQEQLSHVLFPLANLTKPQVRALARTFKLPTAEKEESMGICFIGEVPMKSFLEQRIAKKPGDVIMSLTGAVIGRHDGLPFYTYGQRHGFIHAGGGEALYVVGKNKAKNQLVVGHANDPALFKKEIIVKNMHWIADIPTFPCVVQARYCHGQELRQVTLSASIKNTKTVTVTFKKPERMPTPGQFLVVYKKNECLGGGVII